MISEHTQTRVYRVYVNMLCFIPPVGSCLVGHMMFASLLPCYRAVPVWTTMAGLTVTKTPLLLAKTPTVFYIEALGKIATKLTFQ